MIATVFGGTLAADVAIFAAILGMFGVILKMLVDQRSLQKGAAEDRKQEIKAVLAEALNGNPSKVSIQQPLRVVSDPQLLTKVEHIEHCAHMERRVVALERRAEQVERKMEADKSEIIKSGESRAIAIHNRINDIDRMVGAIDERSQATDRNVISQGHKIDDLKRDLSAQPAQIVALLKSTKGLIE